MIPSCLNKISLLALASAVCLPAFAQSSDWTLAGPFGGTATTITVDEHHPGTLLAGALDDLLYRSEDGGATWTLIDFPPRSLGEITSLLIDPSDSNHYLAGVLDASSGALFESYDAGKTWKTAHDISDFGVRALAASKSNPSEFAAGTLKGVMLSSDSGKTWHRISDPNNLEMRWITSLAIDPADPNVIYAGTSHLPWKTTDGGKTWGSIHDGMIDDSDVFSIYVDPKNPSDVFASACSGIYASQNSGEMWSKIGGVPNYRTHVIRLDPGGSGTVFAGTTTGLFASISNSKTWRKLNDVQVNSMMFDPENPEVMYLAMLHAGLGKSDDSGQVIQPVNQGFVDRYINGITVSGDDLVAIEEQEGESTGLFTSADSGATWTQLKDFKGLAGVHLRSIAGATNGRVLFGANTSVLFRSDDHGVLWKPVTLKVVSEHTVSVAVRRPAKKGGKPVTTHVDRTERRVHTLKPENVSGLWVAPEPSGQAIYLAANSALFKTVDSGENWTQVALPGALRVDGMFAGSNPDAPLFIRTSDGLFASRDHGAQWDAITFPRSPSEVNDFAASADGTHVLAATTAGLLASSDGGKTWTAAVTGLPNSTVSSVVFTTGQVAYAAQYGQLYRSNDGGQHWDLLPTRFSHLSIWKLWCPDQKRLYAVSNGLGVLFRD